MQNQNNPKPRKIQARSIRAAIRKQYPSIVAFARAQGISRHLLEVILTGRKTSRRVAEMIAAVYGAPPHVIWPGKYAAPDASEPSTTAPAA